MSAPAQQATIRQYAKQLRLATIGGQFAQVAEQAIRQKQSHLSYLEALLGAEVEERDRNAVARRIKEAPRDLAQPATGQISAGARVVIAPMGGFETYFAAAMREKKVPITLTLDKDSAQYFVVSTETEWHGFVYGSGGSANWNQNGGSAAHGSAASSTRGLEASIMLIDARTKDVVWAYEVHKNSHGGLLLGTHAARGQQSLAEACAKHLKEFIEKGK